MIKTDINEISHETEFLTEASYSVVAKGIPKKNTKNHYTKDEIKKKFQVWGDVLDVEVIQESRKMEKSVAIVTFENTHSHNKCLEDFKIASGDDCWNRTCFVERLEIFSPTFSNINRYGSMSDL